MAYRATKSGINAEVEKKREANYPKDEEIKAREWIETMLDTKLEGDFFPALKDGSKLCSLLNKLEPGLVKEKFEKPNSLHMKQIEAIGVFIDGCKKYGMSEKDLFVSLDLHEEQNKTMVIATLFSLGRQAQKKGYEGPAFGPKEAEANQREFSEAQIREGRNTIGLQMGTNQVANQKGMTPYGHARQIADVRTV